MKKERFAHLSHAEMTKADRTMHHPPAVSKDLLPGGKSVPLLLSKGTRTTEVCLSSNGLNVSLTRPTFVHTRICTQIKNTGVFLKPQQMCASLFFFLGLERQLLFLLCPEITELTSTNEWSSTGIWHENFLCSTSDQALKFVLSHGTC